MRKRQKIVISIIFLAVVCCVFIAMQRSNRETFDQYAVSEFTVVDDHPIEEPIQLSGDELVTGPVSFYSIETRLWNLTEFIPGIAIEYLDGETWRTLYSDFADYEYLEGGVKLNYEQSDALSHVSLDLTSFWEKTGDGRYRIIKAYERRWTDTPIYIAREIEISENAAIVTEAPDVVSERDLEEILEIWDRNSVNYAKECYPGFLLSWVEMGNKQCRMLEDGGGLKVVELEEETGIWWLFEKNGQQLKLYINHSMQVSGTAGSSLQLYWMDVTGDGEKELLILVSEGGTGVLEQDLYIVDVSRMKEITVDPEWVRKMDGHIIGFEIEPDQQAEGKIYYTIQTEDAEEVSGYFETSATNNEITMVTYGERYHKFFFDENNTIHVMVPYNYECGVSFPAGEIFSVLEYDQEEDVCRLSEKYRIVPFD